MDSNNLPRQLEVNKDTKQNDARLQVKSAMIEKEERD